MKNRLIKQTLVNWYGFHGYISSKDMPVKPSTPSFRVVTPVAKKAITFRFSHPVQDVHGNVHSWLFEGDAPEGYVLSITVANDTHAV